MSHDLHLADHERLLLEMKPAPSVLVWEMLLGVVEGVVAGIVVWVLANIFLGDETFFISGSIAVVVFALAVVRRVRAVQHSAIIITTDRIMVLGHEKYFFHKLHTLKWPQFQECILGHRSPLGFFFGAAPLSIRYGNADSKLYHHVAPVRYASDIKHYLDKVDTLVKRNALNEIQPFIAKPKGKRV